MQWKCCPSLELWWSLKSKLEDELEDEDVLLVPSSFWRPAANSGTEVLETRLAAQLKAEGAYYLKPFVFPLEMIPEVL